MLNKTKEFTLIKPMLHFRYNHCNSNHRYHWKEIQYQIDVSYTFHCKLQKLLVKAQHQVTNESLFKYIYNNTTSNNNSYTLHSIQSQPLRCQQQVAMALNSNPMCTKNRFFFHFTLKEPTSETPQTGNYDSLNPCC